ncbi:hypothetical protein ACFPRL_04900 [Pseudoclavibacter helvolus]
MAGRSRSGSHRKRWQCTDRHGLAHRQDQSTWCDFAWPVRWRRSGACARTAVPGNG